MPSLPFDESHTFTPPPAFGPYRVLHQVGSGVLGPVFRTYDPQRDRLVAVKAFRLDLVPEDVARLADALRRLTGAAGQIAAGLEGTTAFLAMDYHAAETLDVALRHLAPAPLDVALPLLTAMAARVDDAWAAGPAHGHGVLHPRDVFVTPGTNAVGITGFGVAPALESIGARPPVRRPYTAPERSAGDPWDVRADVYSLGAIAHELLTGRRPAGPGQQDGSLPATMAPEIRVQIRRVLAKALAESPAGRFASARDFVEALANPSALVDAESSSEAVVAAVLPLSETALGPEIPLEAPPINPEPPLADRELLSSSTSDAAAVTPSPRRRARVVTPAPRPPVRAADRDGADASASAPLSDPPARTVDDLRLAPDALDRPVTVTTIALPSPFPWAPFIAGCVASFVLGGVAMRDWMQRATPAVVAPARTPSAPTANAPITPAATDTEVHVTDPVAPASPGKADPAPAPVSGQIAVKSTPSGAAVTVNGKPAGLTPLTVADLAMATHSVVVSKPGFVSETRKVVLSVRAPSGALQVTLDPERAVSPPKTAPTGSITVDSRPKGARVTIDGRSIGTTPLSAPGFKPGTHTVRVELAGHKPVVTTVVVKAGETAKVAVTLEQR